MSVMASVGAETTTEFVFLLAEMLTTVPASTFVAPAAPPLIWSIWRIMSACGVRELRLLLDDRDRGDTEGADFFAGVNRSVRFSATSAASVFLSVKIRTSLTTVDTRSSSWTRGSIRSKSLGLARTITLLVRMSATTVTCDEPNGTGVGGSGTVCVPRLRAALALAALSIDEAAEVRDFGLNSASSVSATAAGEAC